MVQNNKIPDAEPQPPNVAELGRNLFRLFLESGRALSNLIDEDAKAGLAFEIKDVPDSAEMMAALFGAWMTDPAKIFAAQASLLTSYGELMSASMRRMLGEDVEPVIAAEATDGRFKDREWSSPYFDFWKQLYLLNSRFAEAVLESAGNLEPEMRKALAYRMKLVTSALSPSNFPMTSPQIIRETLDTNGKNLVAGMRNLVGDMERPGEAFNVSQTDLAAFEVGKNLATTKGSVVLETELFQLIQYAPRTEAVREVPLLIVPPWINKYYILDLSPEKSFVQFAVDQGFTVFLMSWVNPGPDLRDKTFENYVTEGLFAAANAVTRETGIGRPNVLGYCIGGTMVSCGLAYLAALEEERFTSATFLTTQVDFSLPGELSLFVRGGQLSAVDHLMEGGTLDGSRMASMFNSLRPKDLIWPYVVNNYLLGKAPPSFDVLYWNQDTTRLPAANHAFYLRQFYNENRLARGEMVFDADRMRDGDAPSNREAHILRYLSMLEGRNAPQRSDAMPGGVRLDLGAVRLPVYELAAREDHIAPAESVFRGSRLLGGDVEFVLAGSGHIAGVINPPAKAKYQFWTSGEHDCPTLADWMSGAQEHSGSWWPNWAQWLGRHAGGWTAARVPGTKLGVIEDAPGRYVKAA